MTNGIDFEFQRTDLNALWDQWKRAEEALPTLILATQQALRAIKKEKEAEHIFAQITLQDSLDVGKPCEGIQLLADALELWAFASAKLWMQIEQQNANAEVQTFHHISMTQVQRLLVRHYKLQDEVVAFCQKDFVLLRLHTLPLLITLPLGEIGRKQE